MNHAEIVFKTNIDNNDWTHVLCDRGYKKRQSIEVSPAGFIRKKGATTLGYAKLAAEEGDCP